MTQVMGMLRLAPEIQERILALPGTSTVPASQNGYFGPLEQYPRKIGCLHGFCSPYAFLSNDSRNKNRGTDQPQAYC